MKYHNTNRKCRPVLLLPLFWLSLAAMGFSQNDPDDPDPYPPKNYPATVLSSDNTFNLRKLEGLPPEKSGENYSCETDLAQRLVKVKDKSGKEIYQVIMPTIRDLDPKLERPGMPDGFKAAHVTRNGNVILRFYELDEFYYSNTTRKFTMMPRFIKEGEDVFQCSGWTEFAEDLFLSHFGTRFTQGDGIAIYDAKTQKLSRLNVAGNLESEYVSLDVYDSVHSIVEVETLRKTDPRHDLEAETTGEFGYHKIEVGP